MSGPRSLPGQEQRLEEIHLVHQQGIYRVHLLRHRPQYVDFQHFACRNPRMRCFLRNVQMLNKGLPQHIYAQFVET